MPLQHNAEDYLLQYVLTTGIKAYPHGPLFRALDRHRTLTDRAMHRNDVLRMVKRRAAAADISVGICCHTFRATGITEYRRNGGTLENAQKMAGHASARTTSLYDRVSDEVSLDEVEKIII